MGSGAILIVLPPYRSQYYQPWLFDCDEISRHSARNWVGDFFEQATANLSQALRYRESCLCPICPDLRWSSRAFFEVKGVGRSDRAIIYQGRLKKDRRLVEETGCDLHYWFWRHKHPVTESETKGQLQAGLAAAAYQVIIVRLADVERYCLSREVRCLNTAYTKRNVPLKYGSEKNGYGYGWAVPMTALLSVSQLRVVVPSLQVYGRTLQNLEVHTVEQLQEDFIVSVGDSEKNKYLYDFEREVNILICERSYCVADPLCMFGAQGLVSRLYDKHPGLRDGRWINAHTYYGHLPAAEGAARWFNVCLLPHVKRNVTVTAQKKLKNPFNLFSDGGPNTLVVGVGFAEYTQSQGKAVFLIFKDARGKPISLNLPEHVAKLQGSQFFFKDWGDMEAIAQRLQQAGLVSLLPVPRITVDHAEVPIAIVNESQLTNFTEEELERYRP
jgi:hypothetical protein